jgi:hypothetical protein
MYLLTDTQLVCSTELVRTLTDTQLVCSTELVRTLTDTQLVYCTAMRNLHIPLLLHNQVVFYVSLHVKVILCDYDV